MVTHGLNLHPERMDDLRLAFVEAGYEVFRPAFTGHQEENGDFLRVRAEEWENDARRFHAIASQRAKELGVPVFLCAYSFSALIFQALAHELKFDRRVYLAPALKMHFWYPVAIEIVKRWPSFTFRSRIFKNYYANARGGARPVTALHYFMQRWREGRSRADGVPTLIWASPKDELVHGNRLRKLAESREGWEFRELSVAGSTLPKKYHHLVVDQAALGKKEFARVAGETIHFFGG